MADLEFRKEGGGGGGGGFQCALDNRLLYLEKRNKVCKVHPLAIGNAPPAKHFDFRTSESFLVPFWGEIARVMDNLLANLVIVFKSLQNLNGRLFFHTIPCGAALIGHVTSGAIG